MYSVPLSYIVFNALATITAPFLYEMSVSHPLTPASAKLCPVQKHGTSRLGPYRLHSTLDKTHNTHNVVWGNSHGRAFASNIVLQISHLNTAQIWILASSSHSVCTMYLLAVTKNHPRKKKRLKTTSLQRQWDPASVRSSTFQTSKLKAFTRKLQLYHTGTSASPEMMDGSTTI